VPEEKLADRPLYLERVLPNFGTFLAVGMLWPAIALVSEPFDIRVGLVIGGLVTIGFWVFLYFVAPLIKVTKTRLLVGRANIERSQLGKIEVITKDRIFEERGPKLDSSAYRVFQGSVQKALKINIKDEKDPTPYWLFSTRRPDQLAAVLRAKP
jgi:hypothetical protein